VEGGRALGFGTIADWGIEIVRIEAVVEKRRKVERKRVENIGKCMADIGEQNPVRISRPGFARWFLLK
jgi:hypothetical protein